MKGAIAVLVLLASTWGAASAEAAGKLQATLENAKVVGSPADSGSSVVTLTLRNSGDAAIDVNASYLPWVSRSGKIAGSAFDVVAADGEQAAFIGIAYDVSSGATDQYTTLLPGEVNVTTIDVARSYRLVEGKAYSVKLRNPIKYLSQPKARFLAQDDASLRAASSEVEVESVAVAVSPE